MAANDESSFAYARLEPGDTVGQYEDAGQAAPEVTNAGTMTDPEAAQKMTDPGAGKTEMATPGPMIRKMEDDSENELDHQDVTDDQAKRWKTMSLYGIIRENGWSWSEVMKIFKVYPDDTEGTKNGAYEYIKEEIINGWTPEDGMPEIKHWTGDDGITIIQAWKFDLAGLYARTTLGMVPDTGQQFRWYRSYYTEEENKNAKDKDNLFSVQNKPFAHEEDFNLAKNYKIPFKGYFWEFHDTYKTFAIYKSVVDPEPVPSIDPNVQEPWVAETQALVQSGLVRDIASIEKKRNAMMLVNEFEDDAGRKGIWTNITKEEFVEGIKRVLANPDLINQGDVGLCGIAMCTKMGIEINPVAFVKLALAFYEKGEFTSDNGNYFEVNKALLGTNDFAGMEKSQFVVLSGIKNEYNTLAYDPNDRAMGDYSDITWPTQIDDLMADAFGAESLIDWYHISFSLEAINSYIDANYTVGWLTSWHYLTSGETNPADATHDFTVLHYVTLESKMDVIGYVNNEPIIMFTIWNPNTSQRKTYTRSKSELQEIILDVYVCYDK